VAVDHFPEEGLYLTQIEGDLNTAYVVLRHGMALDCIVCTLAEGVSELARIIGVFDEVPLVSDEAYVPNYKGYISETALIKLVAVMADPTIIRDIDLYQ
jgi:hypothetical protein